MKAWMTGLLLFLFAGPAALASDNLKAFPAAGKGMVRHVLNLPSQENESLSGVELIVGKTVEVDDRNRYFFTGTIRTETIEGWGYMRYMVDSLGVMAGSRIAVDPGAPKVARFVQLGGEPHLIRYNSHLPVVVYVPEGVEVRYRIWAAGAEEKAMEQG